MTTLRINYFSKEEVNITVSVEHLATVLMPSLNPMGNFRMIIVIQESEVRERGWGQYAP